MSNILNKVFEAPLTAYGEIQTAQRTPLVQVTAQYGILGDMLFANIGGTTTTANGNFIASTGAGANNVSALISAAQAQYRAAQGLSCEISAIFSAGVANNTQYAGFISSESILGFGYDGTSYGIVHATGGGQELYELTITTPAAAPEVANVTVNGVVYNISLTAISTAGNAFQIATYLNANVPGYDFSAVQNVVYGMAQLPDLGGLSWAFTSATAVAAWVLKQAGMLPIETWIPKASWNVNPDIVIDPTLGNVYKIQIGYLGYSGMFFSMKNPTTSRYEIVHVIHYENTSVVPSVVNPIFRVGWATRNTGNTTDIQVKGASAGAFLEGEKRPDSREKGLSATRLGVGLTALPILCVRNRLAFNNTSNRAEILPDFLSISSETPQLALFEIISNPTYTGYVEYSRFGANSLMEYSFGANATAVTGNVIGSFAVSKESPQQIILDRVLSKILPNEEFCITARITSGGVSTMVASINWLEDL